MTEVTGRAQWCPVLESRVGGGDTAQDARNGHQHEDGQQCGRQVSLWPSWIEVTVATQLVVEQEGQHEGKNSDTRTAHQVQDLAEAGRGQCQEEHEDVQSSPKEGTLPVEVYIR